MKQTINIPAPQAQPQQILTQGVPPLPHEKAQYYQQLAEDLGLGWELDWALYVTAPDQWGLARQIDTWLVEVRDHPAISLAAYQMQGERLRQLYTEQQYRQSGVWCVRGNGQVVNPVELPEGGRGDA